jgi:N-methylhydantoinase B
MTMLHAGNGGMCFIDSVELDEVYTPILVKTRRLIADSEGAGSFRGAPGILVEFGPTGGRMQAVFVADGNINNPKGARGGLAAAPSAQHVGGTDGRLRNLPQYCDTWVEDGETIISVACGGGGYGPAEKRNPERVLNDVKEGLVTRERAERVYRVAITPDLNIDSDATERLRQIAGRTSAHP